MSIEKISLRSASPALIEQLREARWRCRYDLKYLCNNILGMPDVSEDLHRPVIDHLQQFPAPRNSEEAKKHDELTNNGWEYTPLRDIMDLEGKRRMLLLDSRGFLKSSINCVAHTVQWIINYPDIAIMVMQSNSEKANLVVGEIKQTFTTNEKFRALFPEFCPTKRVWEWGRADSFTVENKRFSKPRGGIRQHKEPTVLAASIERGMAGIHVDVIKCSDIVEPSNINGEGLETVKKNLSMAKNLLVAPQYWIDVEGTRYHFDDAYGDIVEKEGLKKESLREWKFFIRGATKRDWGGQPERFDSMDFLMKPELLGPDGYAVSRWPTRFPSAYLESMKIDNPLTYATQQQQDPRPGGVALFPVNHEYPKWITVKDFIQNIRVSSYDISIDTAETTGKRSDYTAITVGAWSASGKCYIVEIKHGRFTPLQVIDHIVALAKKYKSRLGRVKIEQTGFVRGLMPGLRREMDLQGLWIPVEEIKRDTQEAKVERIANTLQPWYMRGDIIFVGDTSVAEDDPLHQREGIPKKTKNFLLKELHDFPAGKNDDILDSLSDLFQGKKWFGRESARHFAGRELNLAGKKLLGILSMEEEAYLGIEQTGGAPVGQFGVY